MSRIRTKIVYALLVTFVASQAAMLATTAHAGVKFCPMIGGFLNRCK